MSRIKSKGNRSTEGRLRAKIVRKGLRGWRLHPKGLEGRPDFAFEKQKVAVFVDGCFWHKCPDHFTQPKTNEKYWRAKINRNVERDREVQDALEGKGWRVLRIWEHEVKKDSNKALKRVEQALQTGKK